MSCKSKVERLIDKAQESCDIETLIDNSGLEVEGENATEKTANVIKLADTHTWFQAEMVDTLAVCWIFNGHDILTRVPAFDFSMIDDFTEMFAYCALLEVVEYIDFSSAVETGGMFTGCSRLTDIRLAPESLKVSITISSRRLSDESIQSIIDGLATVEELQTLTLNSSVTAKLTTEQMLIIANKNWTTG